METGTARQAAELTAQAVAYVESNEPPPSGGVQISVGEGDPIDVITTTTGNSTATTPPGDSPLTYNVVIPPGVLPPADDNGPAGTGGDVPVGEVVISVP